MLSQETGLTLWFEDDAGAVRATGALGTYAGRLDDPPDDAIVGTVLSALLRDPQQAGATFAVVCQALTAVSVKAGLHVDVSVRFVEPFVEPPAAEASGPHRRPPSLSRANLTVPDDDAGDEPTGIIGTLRELSVAEIVQMLAAGRRTATVEIVGTGRLAVEEGVLVAAACGGLVGAEAFVALNATQRGTFRIRYGRRAREHNIEAPTTYLLLEAARQLDEATAREPSTQPVDLPVDLPVTTSRPPFRLTTLMPLVTAEGDESSSSNPGNSSSGKTRKTRPLAESSDSAG